MSIFADLFTGLCSPVVSVYQGQDVVRWPVGVEADALTVEDVIWMPQNSTQEGTVNPQVTFGGTMSLPGATVIAEGDLWIIEAEEYRVRTPGFVDPHTGRLELEMVRADRKVIRNVSGQITLRKGFN